MGMQVKEEPESGLSQRFSAADAVESPLGIVCAPVVMIHRYAPHRRAFGRCADVAGNGRAPDGAEHVAEELL